MKAVVLLSGGLDSATVLAIARSEGFECHALTIVYGQRHSVELDSAKRVASALGAASHREFPVPLHLFGGSALTEDIPVPKGGESDGIPVTYVPARNTVMLAVALAMAETTGASAVFCGVNAVDYSGYPDCRPEFIAAFEHMAQLATKSAVEGRTLQIKAPLMNLTKSEIIELGQRLGVDYGITHSCYDPLPDGRACSLCDSCCIRAAAFAQLGQEDPAIA